MGIECNIQTYRMHKDYTNTLLCVRILQTGMICIIYAGIWKIHILLETITKNAYPYPCTCLPHVLKYYG